MATAADIRAQVAAANRTVEEAINAIHMAHRKAEEAIMSHQATDSDKLAPAISMIRNAAQSLEQATQQFSTAVDSANQYAVRV